MMCVNFVVIRNSAAFKWFLVLANPLSLSTVACNLEASNGTDTALEDIEAASDKLNEHGLICFSGKLYHKLLLHWGSFQLSQISPTTENQGCTISFH